MTMARITPERITKPIQLLAVWLTGLVILDGMLLAAAVKTTSPIWLSSIFGIAAVVFVPLFLGLIFVMQTRFRPQLQEDPYYAKYLQSLAVNPTDIDQSVALRKSVESRLKVIEQHFGELEGEMRQTTGKTEKADVPQEIERLEGIKREQEQLMSEIGHQVRAPLHSLLIAVARLQILTSQEQPKTKQIAEVTSRIEAIVFRLCRVMETVRFQVLGDDDMPLADEPLDVHQFVFEVVRSLKPFAEARGTEITLRPGPQKLVVRGNAEALKTALYNILENALKYGFKGKPIDVAVSRLQNEVEIRVVNEGIAIAEQEIPNLFKPGYRSRNAVSTYEEGAGLGLYVTAKILKLHGGKVEISSSEPNRVVARMVIPV